MSKATKQLTASDIFDKDNNLIRELTASDIFNINDDDFTYEQSLIIWDAIAEQAEKGERQPVETNEKKKKEKEKITIRLFKNDLEQIKDKADIDGIPYQTLITSIIHKYINGTLIE